MVSSLLFSAISIAISSWGDGGGGIFKSLKLNGSGACGGTVDISLDTDGSSSGVGTNT